MACLISSEQGLSQLIRCAFKQCTPRQQPLRPYTLLIHRTSSRPRRLSTRSSYNAARAISEQSRDTPISFDAHSTPTASPTTQPSPKAIRNGPSAVVPKKALPPNDINPGKHARKRARRDQAAKETKSPSTRRSKATAPHPPAENKAPEEWRLQKAALQEKFPEQPWNPQKKLSPDALEGIRAMHAQYPEHFTTPLLADHFKVSPEAIRRILKSKWRPRPEEEEDRRRRWERRGERVWTELVGSRGMHPPRKWRDKGIGAGIPRLPSGQLSISRASPRLRWSGTATSSTEALNK